MSLPSTWRADVTGSSAGSAPACRASWPPHAAPPRHSHQYRARATHHCGRVGPRPRIPTAAVSRCRVPDSGGTADGNDQDQQLMSRPCGSTNKPNRSGTSALVACLGSLWRAAAYLPFRNPCNWSRPAPVARGAGIHVLPFGKSLHKARPRTRIPIRVPVQSRPMGPIRPAAHQHRRCGSGLHRLLLLALFAEMERAPGRPGTPR
jgi:hypothetical protein